MKRVFLLVFICLSFISTTHSQNGKRLNSLDGDMVLDIVDGGNDLWLATKKGLIKFDKRIEQLSHFTKANAGLPDDGIYCITLDSSGNVWLGTFQGGIGKFNIADSRCTVYNTTNSGLPANQVTAIKADASGNIWIGSLMFLTKFDGKNWNVFEAGSSLDSFAATRDIALAWDGSLWLGMNSGLGKFDRDTVMRPYAGLKDEIWALAIDKYFALWVGTYRKGLTKYDGRSLTTYNTLNSKIPSDGIYDMKFDSKGLMWLGMSNGLASFDGTNWVRRDTPDSLLTGHSVYSIAVDREGVLWIGTGTMGLFKYDGTKWKHYRTADTTSTGVDDGTMMPFPNSSSLSQNYPNPFNPSTTIKFTVPARAFVTLKIFDALGREAATLAAEELAPGSYERQWNAADMPSGVYFCTMKAGSFSATRKVALIR